MAGRVIGTRLPCCPGKDSRLTIKHNMAQPGQPWWIYYDAPQDNPIPADEPHADLVALVNAMKTERAGPGGGAFSINEHGQVIARMAAPAGSGNTQHVINVTAQGTVSTYFTPIRFGNGVLDPKPENLKIGDDWPGPLSGMSYKFVAPGNAKPPSRNLDEVFVEEEGVTLQLSTEAGINPYPPVNGPLADFLKTLRKYLPQGGRFRVNPHGRAFTSDSHTYLGVVPIEHWFKPLTDRS